MMIRLSDAMSAPHEHKLVHGEGYVRLGPLTNGPQPTGACYPPAGTVDGSLHQLSPPNGHEPVVFQWLMTHAAWFRLDPTARRVAFKADYLSSHGWKYLSVATGWH